MIRIIFKNGEIMECEDVDKIVFIEGTEHAAITKFNEETEVEQTLVGGEWITM